MSHLFGSYVLAVLLALVATISCNPVGNPASKIEDSDEGSAMSQPDEGEPTPFFLKEVRKYFEENKNKRPNSIISKRSASAINSGDTVNLQTTQRYTWVSCWRPTCDAIQCPGLYFDSDDYPTRCRGEVFQIYRAAGSGNVRVGDLVAFHYPHLYGHWFGNAASTGYKTTCPGSPTLQHGFINSEKWYQCVGEVLVIYARGKSVGATINEHDDIRLYYLNGRDWISWWGGTMHRNPCPGQTRPPTVSSYDDGCFGETFKIWKRH